MVKKNKISIKDILKGKFLVDNYSASIWKFIIYLVFLTFLMISSSHLIDKKTDNITGVKKEVSRLKSKYANILEQLAKRENRIYIANEAKKNAIFQTLNQPVYLTDTVK